MDRQDVKVPERLLKSAQQYFCHFCLLLLKKTISKKSYLVVSETLRLFVNILIPDDMCSLSVTASG